MKIILANGTELTPIIVTGESRYVQGASRDVLTFVFADRTMDELDEVFTETNCEVINIVGDEGDENIHKGYVVRVELSKKEVVTEQATTDTEEVREMRVFVSMGQRTYSETQIANLSAQAAITAEELTYTQLALTEIYESM